MLLLASFYAGARSGFGGKKLPHLLKGQKKGRNAGYCLGHYILLPYPLVIGITASMGHTYKIH